MDLLTTLQTRDNTNLYRKTIQFFTCTTHSKHDFVEKSPLYWSLKKLNLLDNLIVCYENKEGLSKRYNEHMKGIGSRAGLVVFVHDDVLIQDVFVLEKLINAAEKYDIIGLAGNTYAKLNTVYCAWHLMCDANQKVGEVAHTKDGVIWTTIFGKTDSPALIVDGLFIAVNVNRASLNELEWDEDFDWHHYDISFCLRAYEKKLRCGVAPISVVHAGLGDSMNSKDWADSNEKFKRKYA